MTIRSRSSMAAEHTFWPGERSRPLRSPIIGMSSLANAPVAVVTGGNRGLGLEICRQLAGEGYRVVLGSRDAEKGRRASTGLAPGVVAIELDVASDDSVARAAEQIR